MSRTRVIGAVEIGTTKVAVLIGELVEGEGMNIIGHVVSSSRGVRKGVIVDLAAAGDCVHAAVAEAENKARTRIDEVFLAQTGRHLKGVLNVGMTNVGESDDVVAASDVERAREEAKRRKLGESRTYIHHIQNPFRLDGREVENPVAKEGRRLEVDYWSVHGDRDTLADSIRVIQGLDLEVSDVIISSIASGALLLEEPEKENGALVIDIGGGTTDYVLYRKGFIVRTGVVAVGGDHITNDLSIGLRAARKVAESVKKNDGRAYFKKGDENEKFWLIGDLTIGDREVPLGAMTKIIDARVAEIFEIIKADLEGAECFSPGAIASGVVLTGGTSRLPGIEEVAGRCFGLEARVGEIRVGVDESLRHPEYSTPLGLLHYAMAELGDSDAERATPVPRGLWRRLTGMFHLN